MRSLALGLCCATWAHTVRADGADQGTRVSATLNAADDSTFGQEFSRLSESEQAETIRILSTDMRGWQALQNLPSKTASPDSARALLAWLNENTPPNSTPFVVNLALKPYPMKLKIERGGCATNPDSENFFAALWRQCLGRMPWRKSAGVACNRELTVQLLVDAADGTALREQPVLKTDVNAFPQYLTGAPAAAFRRKTWENVEIVLASLLQDTSLLSERLRVIEVANSLSESTFLRRRQTAISLRAGSHRVPASVSPGARK